MNRQRQFAALVVGAAVLLLSGLSQAQDAAAQATARRQAVDAKADGILDDLFRQRPPVRALFDEARGYAVFSATKAGFLVTGGGGTGVAVDKQSGRRTYMRMGTGGVGLGIGAQRYGLVILFEDEARLNRFIAGGWDASTTAQAAAGSDGIAVTSSFVDGVAIYQLTDKGLMAQADVSGTRFWAAQPLN
jgi:lipid-binding SYLF domain-containing protein